MQSDLPSRRSFLATLTLATAASLTRFHTLQAAISQSALQGGFAVGPQAWTFRVFSVQEAIAKAAEAGAKCIELFPGQKFASDDDKNANFDHNSPAERSPPCRLC
jgi:hypothetical protein